MSDVQYTVLKGLTAWALTRGGRLPLVKEQIINTGNYYYYLNKYERYYRPGRRPLACLLYYILTVSPACA